MQMVKRASTRQVALTSEDTEGRGCGPESGRGGEATHRLLHGLKGVLPEILHLRLHVPLLRRHLRLLLGKRRGGSSLLLLQLLHVQRLLCLGEVARHNDVVGPTGRGRRAVHVEATPLPRCDVSERWWRRVGR